MGTLCLPFAHSTDGTLKRPTCPLFVQWQRALAHGACWQADPRTLNAKGLGTCLPCPSCSLCGRRADGKQERPDRFDEATGPALVPIETAMEAMGGSKGRWRR